MDVDRLRRLAGVLSESVSGSWRLVPIDDLPKATRDDIAIWIHENHPYFADSWDWTEVRDNLFGLTEKPMVWVGKMPVDALYKTMKRSNSARAVSRYRDMLRSPRFEFDPILVADGRFLDGGHRLEAYKAAGRQYIPVVEVGHIVNAPVELWELWMEGEPDVRFEPGPHP